MKNLKFIFGLLISFSVFFTSCEDDANADTELTDNISTTDFAKIASDDIQGGIDEFGEECFELVYPVTVLFNDETSREIASEDDLIAAIEEFVANENVDFDDLELPTFEFPIQVKNDSATFEVASEEEFEDLLDECYYDDYERSEYCKDHDARRGRGHRNRHACVEFVFPLTFENGTETVEIENRKGLRRVFRANRQDTASQFVLVFPIEVSIEGETESVNSQEELEEIFEDCSDDFEEIRSRMKRCFQIVYPVQFSFEDETYDIANKEDLKTLFMSAKESEERPEPVFPIEVIKRDSTTSTINSIDDFELLKDECKN